MNNTIGITIFSMVSVIMIAFIIAVVFSFSRSAANSTNNASSEATKLLTQIDYYPLERVDCRDIEGREAIRLVEQYYGSCTIDIFTLNKDATAKFNTLNSLDYIFDTTKVNFYIKEDAYYYVVVRYDDNEKLSKIELTEQIN